MKKRRESAIEREFRKYVGDLGGKCYKFVSPGNRGVADRLIMLNGIVSFLELKATGETLDPLQEYFQRETKKQKKHSKNFSLIQNEKSKVFKRELYLMKSCITNSQ